MERTCGCHGYCLLLSINMSQGEMYENGTVGDVWPVSSFKGTDAMVEKAAVIIKDSSTII